MTRLRHAFPAARKRNLVRSPFGAIDAKRNTGETKNGTARVTEPDAELDRGWQQTRNPAPVRSHVLRPEGVVRETSRWTLRR
jgi:hypothetical protein